MQLVGDHIRPIAQGGPESPENLATACYYCNFLCSKMKFGATDTVRDILKEKKKYVKAGRRDMYDRWLQSVAQYYAVNPFRPLP